MTAPRTMLIFAAAIALTFIASNASAEQGLKKACADDISTHCDHIEAGQGRIIACLNGSQISDGCRTVVDNAMHKRAELEAACSDDLARLCSGKEGREAARCLRSNEGDLSHACVDELGKHKRDRGKKGKKGKRGKGIKKACKADIETLCPEASGREDVRACIETHRDELSAECAAKVEKKEQRFAEAVAACGDDAERFCPEASQPKELRRCMKEHREELSASCEEFIESKRGEGKKGTGKRGKRRRM